MDNVTTPAPKNQIAGAILAGAIANDPAYGGTGLGDYTATSTPSYRPGDVKYLPMLIIAVVIYLIWF